MSNGGYFQTMFNKSTNFQKNKLKPLGGVPFTRNVHVLLGLVNDKKKSKWAEPTKIYTTQKIEKRNGMHIFRPCLTSIQSFKRID